MLAGCLVIWLFSCLVVCSNLQQYCHPTKQQDTQTTKQQDKLNNKTNKQQDKLNNKLCLEDSTERSESNPGQSLGIYKLKQNDCLEDSTFHALK